MERTQLLFSQLGQFPNASLEIAAIIRKAFYVDDLLYGADSVEEAKHEIGSISTALSAGP